MGFHGTRFLRATSAFQITFGIQRNQIRQNPNLNDANYGSTLVARQFHIVAGHGHDNTAATIDTGRFVQDRSKPSMRFFESDPVRNRNQEAHGTQNPAPVQSPWVPAPGPFLAARTGSATRSRLWQRPHPSR